MHGDTPLSRGVPAGRLSPSGCFPAPFLVPINGIMVATILVNILGFHGQERITVRQGGLEERQLGGFGCERLSLRAWRAVAEAVFILQLFSLPLVSEGAGTVRERITFTPTGVSVRAEKADSPEKRERGLMLRTRLGEKDGMIFYFDVTAYHTFWMYHTLIPLTVIFLDDGLKIVDMQNMSPCPEKNSALCAVYAAQRPARFAIEVNQGFVGKYGIKIGDHVTIESAK